MADNETEQVPVKPKNNLLLIMLIVNLLAVAGTSAYFLFFNNAAKEEKEEDRTASNEGEAEEPTVGQFGPLIALTPIVVNLNDPTDTHFLKATVHLEVTEESAVPKIEAAMVPIRDRLLTYLSSLTLEEIKEPKKRNAIQNKIVAMVNELMGSDLVSRVFFTEFVIQ